MTSKDTAEQTRKLWALFDKFSYQELEFLLKAAGVVPAKKRTLLLAQALIVWYRGSVPNFETLDKLTNS